MRHAPPTLRALILRVRIQRRIVHSETLSSFDASITVYHLSFSMLQF